MSFHSFEVGGGLPEVGCARRREARAAGRDRSREVFDLGQFLRLLLRIISRRRRGPKLAARRDHPCPPCPCERLEWICPTPETGPGRDLACEDCVGAVGLRARDYQLRHLAPPFPPRPPSARRPRRPTAPPDTPPPHSRGAPPPPGAGPANAAAPLGRR